eukprot:3948844-Pyramimonas_sp.AAC.2
MEQAAHRDDALLGVVLLSLDLVTTVLAALHPLGANLGEILSCPLRGNTLGPGGVVHIDGLAPRLLVLQVHPAEGNLISKAADRSAKRI